MYEITHGTASVHARNVRCSLHLYFKYAHMYLVTHDSRDTTVSKMYEGQYGGSEKSRGVSLRAGKFVALLCSSFFFRWKIFSHRVINSLAYAHKPTHWTATYTSHIYPERDSGEEEGDVCRSAAASSAGDRGKRDIEGLAETWESWPDEERARCSWPFTCQLSSSVLLSRHRVMPLLLLRCCCRCCCCRCRCIFFFFLVPLFSFMVAHRQCHIGWLT